MPEDRRRRSNQDENKALPWILAGGVAAAAALLLFRKKPPVITFPSIELVEAYSECRAGTDKAVIFLRWVSDTADQDFDVLKDGVTIDTVRGLTWNSLDQFPADQGQTHDYHIIGVQTAKESNVAQVKTISCVIVGQPTISNVQVAYV